MEIKIDPEFKNLIPPISKDEFDGLEKSILSGGEGCRDPLILWNDTLIDGHNRYEICTRHAVSFKTIAKSFDDREQAKRWIIANQLSRRNLAPEQIKYLIGIKYKLEKKEPGGDHKSKGQNDPLINASEKIAQEHGGSPRTVKRAEKFAEVVDKLPPEKRNEVLSGKSEKTIAEIVAASLQPPQGDKNKKLGKPSKPRRRSDAFFMLHSWWRRTPMVDKKDFAKFAQEDLK